MATSAQKAVKASALPFIKAGKRVLPELYSLEHDCFPQSQPGFVVPPPDGQCQDTIQQLNVLDESDTKVKPWIKLVEHLNDLNASADQGTTYKLIYFIKTGQAVHDIAQLVHGAEEWASKWSRETTDGKLTWGPDAELTIFGEGQGIVTGATLTQLSLGDFLSTAQRQGGKGAKDAPPLMQSAYTSPLRRATQTLDGVLACIAMKENDEMEKVPLPCILEDLRPPFTASTADMRSTKSEIQARHPGWRFNTSFSEEDRLTRATLTMADDKAHKGDKEQKEEGPQGEKTSSQAMKEDESELEFQTRMKRVLDTIFSSDANACIGIMTHGSNINAFRAILGREPCRWPHGYIVPMLIKAEGMYVALECEIEAENDEVSENDDEKKEDDEDKKKKEKERKDKKKKKKKEEDKKKKKRKRDDEIYYEMELE